MHVVFGIGRDQRENLITGLQHRVSLGHDQSVGSHDGTPAVWTTANGTTWTTIVLPVPTGATSS